MEQDQPQAGDAVMPWSGEQQRLLRAMGYELFVQATATTPMSTALPMAKAAELPATDLGRLLRSLQLAAMGQDVSALIADVAELRCDARAKRALWPKLRALRRPH
jgi:hypothetical protein